MRKLVRVLLCLCLALPLCAQTTSPTKDSKTISTSGNTVQIGNGAGGLTATFEEVIYGGPSTTSITVQGCMRGANTCDTAADTNTSTSTTNRSVSFTKVYDYFLVTASWTGGTAVAVTINSTITTAKSGSSSGGTWGSITGTLSSQTDLQTALDLKAPLASPTFTGTPVVPTAAVTTSSTQAASTAFVQTQVVPNVTTNPWVVTGPLAATSTGSLFNGNNTNQAKVIGLIAPFTKTTTKVCYEIGATADNTANTYDIGFYSGSSGGAGTLLGHIGPTAGTTFAPTINTYNCINWLSSFTIPAGRIYVALTTSATSAQAVIFGASAGSTVTTAINVAITAGGTLSALTLPADGNSGAGFNSTAVPWLSIQ